jgi:hypothetical protein
MPGSSLNGNRAVPALKPPFDIIYRIAQEARACESARPAREGEKKQAEDASSACPTLLPLLVELRTCCYEHKIEEIPAFLGV